MLNSVYRVTFSEAQQSVVVRVRRFQHPEYGQEFAAERFAYHLIEEMDIDFPRLLYVCTASEPFGYPFAVFDFVDGPDFPKMHPGYAAAVRRARGLTGE
ncbi:MAG: phosphotransferase, partial [Byssovorax sp.]